MGISLFVQDLSAFNHDRARRNREGGSVTVRQGEPLLAWAHATPAMPEARHARQE